MSPTHRPRIGIALGSGSAKGIAHLGVLRALEKHNIPIDFIAGSSIGAVIGAYYAHNPSITALSELAYNVSERKLSSILDIGIKGGFIKGLKIEKLLEEMLDDTSFDDLKIPLAVVSTDLINAEVVVFEEGNLIKAVRASIAIPGFLKPIEYNKRTLADGGLSNPVPVDMVRKMGADIVIGVNLDNLYVEDSAASVVPPLTRLPSHSINILRHHLALLSTKDADIIIAPNINSGILGWRDFFIKEKLDEFIKEGERAAEEQIHHIHTAIEQYKRAPSKLERIGAFISALRKR